MLAYATAISYSELAKLYPGAGSSYLFAEQAFLNTTQAYRFARIAKFIIGWASHLYYWVYPGVMVATIGVMIGYIVGTLAPGYDEPGYPGAGLHGADRDHFLVRRRLHRVSRRDRLDQRQCRDQRHPDRRAAVLLRARDLLPPGPSGGFDWVWRSTAPAKVLTTRSAAIPRRIPARCRSSLPHNFNWMMLQATVAILLLVGFESVTALGEEAKEPQERHPARRASLAHDPVPDLYLIEYFAANYFLNSAYSLADAKGSAAPIGDMMVILGNALMGGHGQAFMLIEAFTVFLALIGTTLSLHQYRRARDLRDGPRRGSSGALRHAARRKPDAASRDLGAGDDLSGARRIRRAVLLRRRLGAR